MLIVGGISADDRTKALPYVELFDFRGTEAFKIIHDVKMAPSTIEEEKKDKKSKDKGKDKERSKDKVDKSKDKERSKDKVDKSKDRELSKDEKKKK